MKESDFGSKLRSECKAVFKSAAVVRREVDGNEDALRLQAKRMRGGDFRPPELTGAVREQLARGWLRWHADEACRHARWQVGVGWFS